MNQIGSSTQNDGIASRRARMEREVDDFGTDWQVLAGALRFVGGALFGALLTLWLTGHGEINARTVDARPASAVTLNAAGDAVPAPVAPPARSPARGEVMSTIPLWAQVLGAIYMATGVFRLACHWPQARRCIVSPELAEGVSLATWTGLLACASVAFLYAVLVVRDWPLIVSTGCNVVGPLMVMGAVAGARSRMQRAGERRSSAPRWRRMQ